MALYTTPVMDRNLRRGLGVSHRAQDWRSGDMGANPAGDSLLWHFGNSVSHTVFSEQTLKAVRPFYLVPMPGEVKDPTHGVNV